MCARGHVPGPLCRPRLACLYLSVLSVCLDQLSHIHLLTLLLTSAFLKAAAARLEPCPQPVWPQLQEESLAMALVGDSGELEGEQVMREEKPGLQHPRSRDLLSSRAVLNQWVAIPAGPHTRCSPRQVFMIPNSDSIMAPYMRNWVKGS